MIVRFVFWTARRLQSVVMWLLDWGCRHSNPPMDLATELARQLLNMTAVYVISPEESFRADDDTGIAMTKH
jgi:hypothetical protein